MERRGLATERGDANREITQRNAGRQSIAALEAEAAAITAEIIDLRAERERRYGPLEDTHQAVAREQSPGRYDELRAAEPPPEITRVFDAAADRTADPAAPVYDRDAAEADWSAKLEAAAIAKAEAAPGAERETRAGAGDRPKAEDTRPLSPAAGEIRLAWTVARSAEELETALAAHGITLARVTAEEAAISQRVAAFAEAAGRFAPVLADGEIVAVDGRAAVHRLTERTTGDTPPEIEARFPGIDRDSLLSVTDAKDAMREASFQAWRDEARQWRDTNTPLSGIETAIADALVGTMTGTDFAIALDEAGLTIARATAGTQGSDLGDIAALAALRKEAELAGTVARTEAGANTDRNARHFAHLIEGDYAAITRSGDVFRLNPTALDFEDVEQRLADVQTRLPSITEARALLEVNRDKAAADWSERQAANAAEAVLRDDLAEGRSELRSAAAVAERAVHGVMETPAEAVDTALDAAGGLLGGAAKIIGAFFSALSSFFGDSGPKLTRQQAKEVLQAEGNIETAHARDYAAGVRAKEAEFDDRMHAQKTSQQQEDLSASFHFGTPPTREANLGRQRDEDYGHERERD
jgi:hypothetical protein